MENRSRPVENHGPPAECRRDPHLEMARLHLNVCKMAGLEVGLAGQGQTRQSPGTESCHLSWEMGRDRQGTSHGLEQGHGTVTDINGQGELICGVGGHYSLILGSRPF